MGLIARVLEDADISTVCLNLRREVAQNVKPPRTLFVKFPFSAPLSPAGDVATHRAVIQETLAVLTVATEPGTIVDSDRMWKK